jgi:hypothetical protein
MTGTGRPPRRLAIAVAALVTLVVVGATWVVDQKFLAHATPPPGVTLTDLRSVDQLRTLFDADALFGPDARWTTTLAAPLSPGLPVIGSSDDLAAAIGPLLTAAAGRASGTHRPRASTMAA